MIPRTEKRFIGNNDEKRLWTYHYTHTQNAPKVINFNNPNRYAVDVVCALNAGSGDTNPTSYESPRLWDANITYTQYLYTNAGRLGTNITLLHNNRLVLMAGGGAGTRAGQVLASRGIHRWQHRKRFLGIKYRVEQKESIGAWSHNAVPHCRQEGEKVTYILTLRPNQSAQITFSYHQASDTPFKGSITLSAYY